MVAISLFIKYLKLAQLLFFKQSKYFSNKNDRKVWHKPSIYQKFFVTLPSVKSLFPRETTKNESTFSEFELSFMILYKTKRAFETMRFTKKVNLYCCVLKSAALCMLFVLSNVLPISISALSTHYIIAFDQSLGKYNSDYLSPKTLSVLTSVLKSADFNPESDYLSIVGYSIEMGSPSMDRFVRPFTSSEGNPIKWQKLSSINLSTLLKEWPQGRPVLSPNSGPYGSLQSLAKPYIVMKTQAKANSSEYADRTIILLATDEVVNGTDDNYAQEWRNISTSSGADNQAFKRIESTAFSQIQNFNEEFKFIQIPLGKNNRSSFPISSDGAYKVVPYEVVAADKPSIQSVTDFPSPLPLQRVRGGYKLAFETQSINHKYSIHQISLFNKEGKLLGKTTDGDLYLTIPSDEVQTGDTLTVSMSLLMKDGFYDGSLISSGNPRYKEGMTSKQVVKIQDEAKVLGLFPLSDAFWLWFPNDVFTAVMLWDLIILLFIIGCVIYLIYTWNRKTLTYNVEASEISLKCVQSGQKIVTN